MKPTKGGPDHAWHVSGGFRCGGLTSLLCDEQVLETVGRAEEAIVAYKARVALGGWAEETFEAQMRVVSSSRVCLMLHRFHQSQFWPPLHVLALGSWSCAAHFPLAVLEHQCISASNTARLQIGVRRVLCCSMRT